MNSVLTVDDLAFEVRRSSRRKTLQVTVDRGGELVISAPEWCDETAMADFVREKKFWIYTKLAEKERLRQPRVEKEFANGEGFLYLGRSHRLLIVEDTEQDVPLKLERGRFRLRRADLPKAREHFIRWYQDHGRAWIAKRIDVFAQRMGVAPAGIELRNLGYRWGSVGSGGRLNFHWVLMQLPAHLVEYVVVHELAHLKEKHHTPDFWLRVERVLADCESRRSELRGKGGAVWRAD